MKARLTFAVLTALLLSSATHLAAAPLLSENFESYKRTGLSSLDANLTPGAGGANSGPNGGPGNAWWGPFAPNLRIVGAELGVTPHSGTNMVRGVAAFNVADGDSDYFNIAYRLNASNVYSGNILLDWWFYDAAGSGSNAVEFQDYLSLANYSNIPTNTDYNSAESPGSPLQSLSLGGTPVQDGTFNVSKYQAEISGVTNGSYNLDGGWFNTATSRSIGWHHARIAASPVSLAGNISVAFYIDDMTNATLTNSVGATNGFNCLLLTADNGNVSAYYDDINFYDHLPAPPVLQIAPAGTNVIVTYPDLWVLQSSTNLAGANFVDVTNAVSPFTNGVTDGQRFFRLRNF